MKRRSIKHALVCSAVICAFTACTDVWEEHYQPNPDLNANMNLWEIIKNEEDLTNFAAFLEVTGYDTLLQENRFYTVWAPTNDAEFFKNNPIEKIKTASKSEREAYRKELIENHIADYSHVAGGIKQEDEDNLVKMLNGKYNRFENVSGSFTFKGVKLASENQIAKNGVLHKIGGYAAYTPSIWEQLQKDTSLESLYAYVAKDYKREYDENASIKGSVVDGIQEILDSAFRITNPWWNNHGYLNREDSSYTMFALNNEAWIKMQDMVKSYFVYPDSSVYDGISDSIAKDLVARHLVFSDKVNSKRYPKGDTLVSNYNMAYSWEKHLTFSGAELDKLYGAVVKTIDVSNGKLNIVDDIIYNPFKCWHDTIRVEGESLANISGEVDQMKNAFKEVKYLDKDEDRELYDLISNRAIGVFKTEGNKQPTFVFNIPNVLSACYKVSIVLLPPQLIDNDSSFIKPNKFTAKITYRGAEKQEEIALGTFISDSSKIDKIVLHECLKIPVCEYKMKDIKGAEKPVTKLTIASALEPGGRGGSGDYSGSTRDSAKWKYDTWYRIDQVIFEPVEDNSANE